jgi:hypothetical protein
MTDRFDCRRKSERHGRHGIARSDSGGAERQHQGISAIPNADTESGVAIHGKCFLEGLYETAMDESRLSQDLRKGGLEFNFAFPMLSQQINLGNMKDGIRGLGLWTWQG